MASETCALYEAPPDRRSALYGVCGLYIIWRKSHFFCDPVEPRIKRIFAPSISLTDDLDLQEQLEGRRPICLNRSKSIAAIRTKRWVGELIRKRLGLKTHKASSVYVAPLEEEPKLQALNERYGIDDLDVIIKPINPYSDSVSRWITS